MFSSFDYPKYPLNNGAYLALLFLTELRTTVHNVCMSNLYNKTLHLLEETSVPMVEVAIGANVGLRWLYDLRSGRFSDPGVNRIERIYNYLSSRPEHLRSA